MHVHIFSYLVNKLEILWVYLSPIEKKNYIVDQQSSCGHDEFQCTSGQCIPASMYCVRMATEDGKAGGCADSSHLLNCCKLK